MTERKLFFTAAIFLLLRFTASAADTLSELPGQFAPLGQLIVTQFVSAPFPHPARVDGHKYGGKLYSAAEHYANSDVAIFIPKNFRVTDNVDFIVHFHGWMNSVASTLEQYKLVEQLVASGKNAILIVPEGPHNAPDSFDGKLEDPNGFKVFMTEAVEKLRASGALTPTNFAIGNIILSGHSGGYHVMAMIADHGGLAKNVREIWLFDALYGNTENYVAWQKAEHGRLLDIYTDHGGTKVNSEALMASLKTNGVNFFASEDTNAVPENVATNQFVFLHTDMVHNDVVSRRGTFEEFLKTSCLQAK
jgi:hypothetical protein